MTSLHAKFPRTAAAAIAFMALSGLFSVAAHAQVASPNAGIEEKVRAAFADAPDMIAVAKCESSFAQFSAPDVVLRGGYGKGYLGIFQIGEQLHTATALALGFDIRTIDGNIGYARHLYDARGIAPWSQCAPSTSAVATPSPTPAPASATPISAVIGATLTQNLVVGMVSEQVRTLQKMLNAAGYAVATSGAGSPGNETNRFGAFTRAALRKFQCAKGIVCEGSESTTGYGRLGPKTRAALLAAPAL